MSPEKTKQLTEKYPTVFKDFGGDPRKTCMHWGICTDDGWFEILDELCSKLEPHGIIAEQIKEKFGGLRFYIKPVSKDVSEKIYNHIREAEIKASVTCEVCGKKGELRRHKNGHLLQTLCESCYDIT